MYRWEKDGDYYNDQFPNGFELKVNSLWTIKLFVFTLINNCTVNFYFTKHMLAMYFM